MSFDKIRFILACLILGFSSMVSQIILFREMIISFFGNELCLGALLFVWLLWVGVGSKLGERLYPKNASFGTLFLWYLICSFILLLTIFGIRFSKIILGIMPGEITSFFPMLFSSFLLLSPLCLLWGIIFVLNSRFWEFKGLPSFLVNRVYLWESLGAGLGGLLTTFVFIPFLSNFKIIFCLLVLNLLLSALIFFNIKKKLKSYIFSFLTCAFILVVIFLGIDKTLDDFSFSKLWRGFPIIYSEDTIYGNISVTKTEEQTTFFENGLMLFSYPDQYSAEEAVLFALSQHPHPKRLLLIGGGLGGAIAQAQKIKDIKIDYVELDFKLIGIAKRFLPEEEILSLDKAAIKFTDGRLYVKNKTKKIGYLYDVVILNLPDPYTTQLNRFYTKEFFRMIKIILDFDGIFSFRVTSQINYISSEQSLYLSSLYRTLSEVFEKLEILPGPNAIFLASSQRELTSDWEKMVANLEKNHVEAEYVNRNFLFDRLNPQRISNLKSSVFSKSGKVNTDLKPISYFYNTILWSTQLNSFEKKIFLILKDVKSIWYLLIPSLFFFASLSFFYKKKTKYQNLALSAIFIVGFSNILLEILILLSYQIFYGYIYSKIGLILTAFMLGLSGGAFLFERKSKIKPPDFRWLSKLQLLQVILPLSLLFLISYFSKSQTKGFLIESSLLILITLSGILEGLEFTSANHLYIKEMGEKNLGTGYSIDLLGSALGSILVSVILVPLLGIPLSLLLAAFLNFVCFIFLMSSTLGIPYES